MNSFKLNPNQTLYYTYHPESDKLAIRLQPKLGKITSTTLPDMPHVQVSRDIRSHAVVGLNINGVQQLILQQFIKTVFEQVQPYLEEADLSQIASEKSPTADPTISHTNQERKSEEEKKAKSAKAKPKHQTRSQTVKKTKRELAQEQAEVRAEPIATTPTEPSQPVAEESSSPITETEETSPSAAEAEEASHPPEEAPEASHPPEEAPEASDSQEEAPEASDAQAEAQEAQEGSDAQAEAQEASDAQAEAPEASDAQAEAQEASDEVKEEGQQNNKPKRPRRRRRKKKSLESATESVTESEVVQGASSEDKSQTDSSRRRKRRRKRRKKKSETSSALTEDTKNEEAVQEALPPTVEREIVPMLSWEERIKNDPRRSYKTNPIPGLGAPEGFAFMEMDDLIGQALYALGFLEPTPIQAKAIPPALEGRDIIGLAQTGTGKTLSFIIPILQNLLTNESQENLPRALIMTPTRELAVQIAEDAEFAGTHTDLLITTIYGGVGFKQQVNELKEGTDMIVATPGRLLDHMKQRTLKLDDIAILVLDEADRMLDMGFLPEIRRIMRQLPNDHQTLLFSATMPSAIERLSSDFQHHPQVIEIARQLPPETISQYLYPVEKHLKVPLLVHLLQETEEMSSVLIFTETKSEAEVVARRLERASLTVALMHGDRKQREREKALQDLRTGAVRILVATNVAARGLDINDISHVINYDMPQSVDDYIHRIGRTARGDATGQAYTFVTIADEGMASRIESTLKQELPREWAEEFNYDVPTPSWAKPSVDQILESLHKREGLAERFNRMIRRR